MVRRAMSQKHTETSPIKSEKPRAAKMELSFSIERILAIDSKPQSKDVHCGSQELAAAKENPVDSLVDLPWLSYTRYSPPKLPRAKRRKSCTRKSSGNPRVPFSTSQLMTLEHKYLETRYLSTPEVSELSDTLSLSEHRIKIWFQNRRAREKKSQISWNGESSITASPSVLSHGRRLVPGWFGPV